MADAEQVPQAVPVKVVQQVVNPPQAVAPAVASAVAPAVAPAVVPAVEAQQLVAGQVQDDLCADQIETSTSPPPPRANPGHLTIFCAREWGI